MLRAQRSVLALRSRLPRNSPEWLAATDELDELNEAIIRGADDPATVGTGSTGTDIDLDCHPAHDDRFRAEVRTALGVARRRARREALADQAEERFALAEDRAVTAAERLAAARDRAVRTAELIARAQERLRRTYPNATMAVASDPNSGDAPVGSVIVRADREGRVA